MSSSQSGNYDQLLSKDLAQAIDHHSTIEKTVQELERLQKNMRVYAEATPLDVRLRTCSSILNFDQIIELLREAETRILTKRFSVPSRRRRRYENNQGCESLLNQEEEVFTLRRSEVATVSSYTPYELH
ncbi:unnamed protein product [Amoebophrya sp. A25]|nr:unnamed protein product [Amoebophrya sp. A25]|eukprot:GSA25T00026306001.1